MTHILVTGGAGFIGSTLVEFLLDAGHHVVVLDMFRHGVPSLNHLMACKELKVVRGDSRRSETLRSLIKKADIIIPLAALVGVRECERDQMAACTTNVGAIGTLLELISGEQFIIYPNSNSGLGSSKEGISTEESPFNPISLYGRLKVQAEQEIMSHENAVSFRLATVFGMSPRMRWDLLVNSMTFKAVHEKAAVIFEGKARRNYVHVRDVARAFLWAIENQPKAENQIFNLGLDEANMTKLELCERIKKQVPDFNYVEHEFAKDPDQRDYYVSSAKLYGVGFKPVYSLDDGIAELVKGAAQYE